jgi:hypothetical protein
MRGRTVRPLFSPAATTDVATSGWRHEERLSLPAAAAVVVTMEIRSDLLIVLSSSAVGEFDSQPSSNSNRGDCGLRTRKPTRNMTFEVRVLIDSDDNASLKLFHFQ